jgi:Phosphate-selective porin O and P
MDRILRILVFTSLLHSSAVLFSQSNSNSADPPTMQQVHDLEVKLDGALRELANTQSQIKEVTSQLEQLRNQAAHGVTDLQAETSAPVAETKTATPTHTVSAEEAFVARIVDPGLGGDQRNNELKAKPEIFVQFRYSTLPTEGATIGDFKSNFRVTRAELQWSGAIGSSFGAGVEFQYQPANDGDPTQIINKAYLQYYPTAHATITAGQFTLPFGFDNEQSSKVRESPERLAVVEYFFPGQQDRGVLLQGNLDSWQIPWLMNVQYFAGVFNGNRLWADNNRQLNYDFRLRKTFESVHLAVGLSGQVGHQLLPPGMRGTDAENAIGFDLQYAFRRFGLRAELLGGNMPSTLFSLVPHFTAAFRPGRHTAGGGIFVTYEITNRDNIYVRYQQVNSDPVTYLTDQAVNFGYFRNIMRAQRLSVDYQWQNNITFNNNAVNTRLQATWQAIF